jgi:hypothetical protein
MAAMDWSGVVPGKADLLQLFGGTLFAVGTVLWLTRHETEGWWLRLMFGIAAAFIMTPGLFLVGRPLVTSSGNFSQLVWYLATVLFITLGIGMWNIRSERPRSSLRSSNWRIRMMLYSALLIGLGSSLGVYRVAEGRWPDAAVTAPVPASKVEAAVAPVPPVPTIDGKAVAEKQQGTTGAVANASQEKSDGSKTGDFLALMALVLTIITGIAVQYVTSSLGTIKQYRDEVDKEIKLFKNYGKLSRKIKEDDLKRLRLNCYLHFNERYASESSYPRGQVVSGVNQRLDDLIALRRCFNPFDLPTDPTDEVPLNLRDVFIALRSVSGSSHKGARDLLKSEHIEYLRKFATRVGRHKALPPAVRTEFRQIIDDLDKALEKDRRGVSV